jgi:hypothetical protein
MLTTEENWPPSLIGTAAPVPPPEPDDRYPSPLRMGQWAHMLIGAFRPLAEDQMVSRKYYGMRHTETWFDLFLRNAEGRYHLLSNVVQSPAEGGLRAGPWLPFPLKSSPEGLVPDLRIEPWDGAARQELTADGKNQYTVETRGPSEVIAFNEEGLEWRSDNGDISLAGELAAPAMQLILPWRDTSGATDVMYYTNQFYKLDGRYGGEPVHGYSMIEHMWGFTNYADTWWVQNRIVHSCHWVTTFDDGITEMGKLLWGEYGARGILIANSKGEVIVNTTEFNLDTREDGRILFSFIDGPQWEFVPEIRVLGFPLVVGVVKRIGETRAVVRSHGLDMSRGDTGPPIVLGQAARPMR